MVVAAPRGRCMVVSGSMWGAMVVSGSMWGCMAVAVPWCRGSLGRGHRGVMPHVDTARARRRAGSPDLHRRVGSSGVPG